MDGWTSRLLIAAAAVALVAAVATLALYPLPVRHHATAVIDANPDRPVTWSNDQFAEAVDRSGARTAAVRSLVRADDRTPSAA